MRSKMEILACVFFSCLRMSYSIGTGPSCGLIGSVCSTGGTIRFDNRPSLVMGAATSSSLLRLPDSSFFLCGKAKTDFFCTGPLSSGGLMALAICSAGTWKIEDGGVVVFRNTEVLCEPGALKISN